MTDNTARQKVPRPNGFAIPRPQQPPPLRRREGSPLGAALDERPVTGSGNSHVTSGSVPRPGALAAQPVPPAPVPVQPVAVQYAAPVQEPAKPVEQAIKAAAFRDAMATLSEDEDKTTAFQVPEELLRRARLGMPGPAFDEDKAPDSGAITAPPPPSPVAETSGVRLGVPGMPKDLDVGSFAGSDYESVSVNELAEEEERSGEFTRINMAGELEALLPPIEKQEPTKTVVRRRLEPKKTDTASAVLWVVIGVLSAAGAVLASLMANG